MPKTTNLRSEVVDLAQAGDKSFVITVVVWEIPGSKDSDRAVRFQFQTHKNPNLWWRLSMTSARQVGAASRAQARYTNAQYNKALRTATDAMNSFIMDESDRRALEAKALQANPLYGRTIKIAYGTIPSAAEFAVQAHDKIGASGALRLELDAAHKSAIDRAIKQAKKVGRADLKSRVVNDGQYTIVKDPFAVHALVNELILLGQTNNDGDPVGLASGIMQYIGYAWV